MIPVPYNFEPVLQIEEYVKIGQLSLRWSHIEHIIGNCLKRMLRLSDDEATVIVFPLSLEQRLSRITQLIEVAPPYPEAITAFNELKLIMPAIQFVRNNVVHALVTEDPIGEHRFILRSKGRSLTKAEIFSTEDLTNYAAHVTVALRYGLGFSGETEGHSYTLPRRPEIPAFLLSVFPALRNPRTA